MREIHSLDRRPDGNLQQEALGASPLFLTGERGLDLTAPLVEQQRIFPRPLRHDALSQPRHEHDAEGAAASLMRRADEQASVAAHRRIPVERHEPVMEYVPGLVERHWPDLSHRTQLCQHLLHAFRPIERAGRKLGEPPEPFAPRRALRPSCQRADDGQRELTQVGEVPQISLDARKARRLRLVAPELIKLVAIVGGQSIKAPAPPRLAVLTVPSPDDRRFEDQLFPLPRRSKRPRKSRVGIGIGRRWNECRVGIFRFEVRLQVGSLLVVRTFKRFRGFKRFSIATFPTRHLSEREVLVEPLGGQPFHRRREERHERAPCRIGPASAAFEIDGHARARARVLEQPEILLRRAQEDRHFIERHAGRRLVQHAAHDLEGFASFAGR